MNVLTKPAQDVSTHHAIRKARAEQREIERRNRKEQKYLDSVVPKLIKFNK